MFNLVPMYIPKYFVSATILRDLLPIGTVGGLLMSRMSFSRIMCDLLLESCSFCFWHCINISVTLFASCSISFLEFPVTMIAMSSAYAIAWLPVSDISSIASSMIRFHNCGPSTDPCGQPLLTLVVTCIVLLVIRASLSEK